MMEVDGFPDWGITGRVLEVRWYLGRVVLWMGVARRTRVLVY
jgi:hypothetical protein